MLTSTVLVVHTLFVGVGFNVGLATVVIVTIVFSISSTFASPTLQPTKPLGHVGGTHGGTIVLVTVGQELGIGTGLLVTVGCGRDLCVWKVVGCLVFFSSSSRFPQLT